MIWLFAGGGESELGNREANIQGLVHFFEKHFPDITFYRITPVRNKRLPPKVKPKNPLNALGKTGESFAKQITNKLEDAIKYRNPLCDVILIIDDLDCCCDIQRKIQFNNSVNQAGNGKFEHTKLIIGFAAPELEAWLVADWDNTIAKHINFRQNQQAMKHWLIKNQLSFDKSETFSFYDEIKNACHEKLSELLIESSRQKNQTIYSKSKHTPFLLYDSLKPEIVAKKCPLFNDFFTELSDLSSSITHK